MLLISMPISEEFLDEKTENEQLTTFRENYNNFQA